MNSGSPVRACAFATALNTFFSSSVSTPPLLADLAERAEPLRLRVAHQLVGYLIRAPRRDVRGIVALHVEPAARDEVDTGALGDAREGREIAVHVGMAAVDDAADAVGAGRFRLRDHQLDVVAEADLDRPPLRFGECLRQRITDRQVLVKQDRAVDRVRRDIFKQRADDGTWRSLKRQGLSRAERFA